MKHFIVQVLVLSFSIVAIFHLDFLLLKMFGVLGILSFIPVWSTGKIRSCQRHVSCEAEVKVDSNAMLRKQKN